jgi:hypothetical protein
MAEANGKTSGTPDPGLDPHRGPDTGSILAQSSGTRLDLPPAIELGEAGDQPSATTSKVSYTALYRYADTWDLAVIAASALCSIAAGAALPLLSV